MLKSFIYHFMDPEEEAQLFTLSPSSGICTEWTVCAEMVLSSTVLSQLTLFLREIKAALV